MHGTSCTVYYPEQQMHYILYYIILYYIYIYKQHFIFISVINQLYAQTFVLEYVYFMPLHVSSTYARNM